MNVSQQKKNPLGYEKLPKLLAGYAIPSIIAMLVSSLYNIVDQIFIGQGVGYLEMQLRTYHFRSIPSAWPLPC